MRTRLYVVLVVSGLFAFAGGSSLAAPPTAQIVKLTPSDAAQGYGLEFGRSVAIDGNYLVVGADQDRTLGLGAGAAYVFRRVGEDWIEQQKLLASDGFYHHAFGWSVAIDDDRIVVGAPFAFGGGAAYVFRRENGATNGDASPERWVEEAILTSAGIPGTRSLGVSTAISGDRVLLGSVVGEQAVGRALMFHREQVGWALEVVLVGEDTGPLDWFGDPVALDGEVAAVSGGVSVYVFRHRGNEWVQEAKLGARDGEAGSSFGASVSLRSEYLLVGVDHRPVGLPGAGSADLFRFHGGAWVDAGMLAPIRPDWNANFGYAVAIQRITAVAGALGDSLAGSHAGSASVYRRLGQRWLPVVQIVAPDSTPSNQCGRAVAVAPTTVAMGCIGEAYLFSVPVPFISLSDFSLFQACFRQEVAHSPDCRPLDAIRDGVIDLRDYRALSQDPRDP